MSEGDLNVVGTTPKPTGSKTNVKIIGAIIGIVVLALGVVAGIVLVRQQQDIREEAAVKMCNADEECPVANDPTHLWSCTPPEADGSVDDNICDRAGRIELCGGRQYCCPSVGVAWTTNLSLCPQTAATATATATASSIATATATATGNNQLNSQATATATPSATSRATSTAAAATSTSTSAGSSATATATSTTIATGATATPFPIPVTGVSWPSVVGVGAGLLILIFSLGLAL